jgi:hypothetical protein
MRFDIGHCPKSQNVHWALNGDRLRAMTNIKSHMANGKWDSSSIS